MKITNVVVHRLSVPLPRPVRTSIHDHAHADTVVVEMRADAGAVGSGYGFAFGAHRARALAALVEDLVPLYLGKEPTAVRSHFARAWQAINFLGHSGVAVMALAALDQACWDLAARAGGRRLLWSAACRLRRYFRVRCDAGRGVHCRYLAPTILRSDNAS